MNTICGISITADEVGHLPDNCPAALRQIEVGGDALSDIASRRKLRHYADRGCFIAVRDLVEPHLARLIPTENAAMRHEFAGLLRDRCAIANKLGATEVGVAFDLARIDAEPEYRRVLLTFLRSCYGVLDEFKLRLLLSGSFPFAAPTGGTLLLELLRDAMYPQLGVMLEVRTDQVEQSRAGWADDLRPMRFFSDRWRLRPDWASRGGRCAMAVAAAGGSCLNPRRVFFSVDSVEPDAVAGAFPTADDFFAATCADAAFKEEEKEI
ncbi:MAG: hypothetical protein PHI35_06445 [Victivallaceae bacterium]|nr:hypothetical protein [Victivallaceae bacterium]